MNWQPVAQGLTAETTQKMALDVATRLADPETLASVTRLAPGQSSFPAALRWAPASVALGNAGLAILFGYLDECFPDAGWDDEGRQHLQHAARSLESASDHSASLFGGLAGVALATWLLSRNGYRYSRLSATLDDAIIRLTAESAKLVASEKDGLATHHFDVISGLAGVGAYLLCRRELPEMRQSLEVALHALVELSRALAGPPRWHTPAALATDRMLASDYPEGFLNCGLSHGIPGPLALLSLAKISGVEVEGQAAAIHRLATWLAEVRTDDQWGVNWPAVVPLHCTEPLGLSPPAGQLSPCRAAWCYGSPGIARSLWLAAQAIDSPELGELALAAIHDALSRPAERRAINSPAFCHGLAGLLQITLRFAVDTGSAILRQAAARMLDELIGAFETASPLGFRSVEDDGRPVDNPGLLNGAPGVALVLLAASGAVEPRWDRLFLLS